MQFKKTKNILTLKKSYLGMECSTTYSWCRMEVLATCHGVTEISKLLSGSVQHIALHDD